MLSDSEVAYAHSLPVSETPAPDSIIKKGEPLPSRITIDFSERPEPSVSTITVLNGKNERVDNGNFVILGDHSREVMTTLSPRHDGFSQLTLFRLPVFHFTNQYPARNYGQPEILGYINAYKRDPY